MLRIITKAKMEHLVSRHNQLIKELSSAKAESNKLALQLELCQEQLGKQKQNSKIRKTNTKNI